MEEAEFSQLLLSKTSLAELLQASPHEPLGGPLVRALGHEKLREHAKSLIMELPLEQVALKLVLALENDALQPHAEECLCEIAKRSYPGMNTIQRLLSLHQANGDKLGQRIDTLTIKLKGEVFSAPKEAGAPQQLLRRNTR